MPEHGPPIARGGAQGPLTRVMDPTPMVFR